MTTPQVGDILLVRDSNGPNDILANLICAGERARYRNTDYSIWTHSALIVNSNGDLIEAMAQGVARGNLTEYNGKEVLIISPPASAEKRAFAVAFAEAHVGDKYGVLDFITLALSLVTGLNLALHSDQTFICSQLVARATESYTSSGYPYPCEAMMPSDLGAYWKALSREPLPPLSFLGRTLDGVRIVGRVLSAPLRRLFRLVQSIRLS